MNSLVVLVLLMVVLMIAVAKRDAIRNLLGLCFNFIAIFALITLTAWGVPILLSLPILSVIILALAIFMSSDEGEITNIAFKTSIIIVLSLTLLTIIVQYFGQFQGFSVENTDELENLSLAVGLNYSDIAIAIMIISMLGAVAEAAMAIVANLFEIIEQDKKMTLEQFKNQRTVISEQILGTAINTLFFGMLGAMIGLVLWFVRLDYSWSAIINSKLLMAEVASMILGMLGILFTIFLAGYYVEKTFERKLKGSKNKG